MQADKPGMTVVYDGGCPFCANYVTLMNLRHAVGAVALVDARTGAPVVKTLAARGYDLNEGMAVLFGDKVYYGEDAVTFISSLTNSRKGSAVWSASCCAARAGRRCSIPS